MRNDIHELGQAFAARTPAMGRGPTQPISTGSANKIKRPIDALTATAIDAAMDDDAAKPVVAQRGSRRELTSAISDVERRTIDVPHATAGPATEASDGALLRRLSQQLSSLQSQQDQIRRLLEAAESRRGPSRTMRLDC
jgi:hypothetical protein